MTYQVVNLTYANVPEVLICNYDELIAYVEKENYKAKRDGLLGTFLAVRKLSSDGDKAVEKIIQLGYTEYVEALFVDLEPLSQSLFGYLKSLFKKPFSKPKLYKTKKGNEPMPPKEDWEYNGEPLDSPGQKDLTPKEERAKIVAELTKKSGAMATSSDTETVEIDYKKQYQEEQKRQAKEAKPIAVSLKKESEEITAEEVTVDHVKENEQSADTHPVQKFSTAAYNLSELSQDNLIKNIAKISEERSLIRQKIQENQAIIEQARRAEIENQTLEMEYQTQEQLLHRLQQFHSLFDEFREYLN